MKENNIQMIMIKHDPIIFIKYILLHLKRVNIQ